MIDTSASSEVDTSTPTASSVPHIGLRGYMAFETSTDPALLFSAAHIKQLTVQAAMDLELPQLCSDEFELIGYRELVHEEDMLRVGELRTHIPSLNEIRHILVDAPVQYGRYGMRSVHVRFRGELGDLSGTDAQVTVDVGIEYPLHFRDIRRWSNIHHLSERISTVRRVLKTIKDEQLLNLGEYDAIMQEQFDRPLRAFRRGLSAVKLFDLHELLDENWLGERLIDGVLDMIADQLNRITPNLIRILDCGFHLELANCYRTQRASPLLIRLREEFLQNPPLIIAFLINKQECHWAPTATILDIRNVLQGDSGGFLFDEDLLARVQWWLQDISEEDGQWEHRELPVELQDARSGSCGLASISAVAAFARHMENTLMDYPSPELSFALWTNAESRTVRSNWIQVILRAHLSASEPNTVRYGYSRNHLVLTRCL